MSEIPQREIEKITPEQQLATTPDDVANAEEREIGTQTKQAELDSTKQDTDARKTYARRIFHLIVYWLIADFILLLIQGFLGPINIFHLSDAVLLALIGGTTANVLGIFMVVVWYLFPKK